MTLLARVRDLALRRHSPQLAICAIFKNEAKNLGEWIAFHRSVGVGHFYLYDNGSTDNFREVLAEHIRAGLVTYFKWLEYPGQVSAYQDCTRRFSGQARWVAFIDIDEFLFSPQQRDVAAVLERFRDCPALFIHSYHFGSSGHRERPKMQAIEAYTRREAIPSSGKTVANPRWIRRISNPHLFRYWGWGHQTPNTERRIADAEGECRPVDVLRINHYWSRSLADLEEKIARTDPLAREVSADHYRSREQSYNAIEDRTIIELVGPSQTGKPVERSKLDTSSPPGESQSSGHRLSVAAVIPLYNGGRYIEAALRSILAQTVLPDEIIVVNDGSTDDGPAIVAKFAETHPITILAKPNGGQSSARNMGVAHARSDLIAFLDQDDIWYPLHIAELSRPFEHDESIGVVYSSLDEIDGAGDLRRRAVHSPTRSQHPKSNIEECLRSDMLILPTAAIVRQSAIEAVGGFDERLSGYEDDDLFLRIFQAGYGNSYLATPLGQWRKHAGSSLHSPRMDRSRRIYAEKLHEMFPEHRLVIGERFFRAARRQLYLALRSGNRDLARQYLAESTSYLGRLPFCRRLVGYGELYMRVARGYLARKSAGERHG